MMKKSVLFIIVILISSITNANLVVNGDFSQGPTVSNCENPDLARLFPGNTELNGWTVTRQHVEYIVWGLKFVDLGGSPSAGGITQTIDTIVGQQYLVSFDLSGAYRVDLNQPVIKHLGVDIAGQESDFFFDSTVNSAPGSPGGNKIWADYVWDRNTLSFTATNPTTKLEFYSLNDPCLSGPNIDNILVEAIPEPCTLLLMSIGGLLLRRKK